MASAMFGIGFGEMVVIAVLILIAVGPDKLPTMVKTVAKTYRQFRRAAMDIRASTGIDDLLRDEELKELAELRKQKLLAMSKPTPKPVAPAPAKPAVSDHAPPPPLEDDAAVSSEEPVPVAPVPAVTPVQATPPGARGLTYEQRTMEMPPGGVDLAEAQHALSAGAKPEIPETRDAKIGEA